MGKGDKKSKRGKISIGSYGNSRRRKKPKAAVVQPVDKNAEAEVEEPVPAKPKKAARKKTEA
ncbi:MAG TPA: 30S ribosomal protein THX [Cyclobacteriaceae bacterium]